jgi:glycosyltransferase involved in cell wall biosynthesis
MLGDYTPEVEKLGIKVILLPQKKNNVDYFAFLKVAQFLKKEKIDVIHTHNTQPFIDGALGGILAGVKTIVHTDHARDFPDKLRYMFAEWFLSHFVQRIVAVSEHTARNLTKYEKISPKKITVVPNGIDGSAFSIITDKKKKRKELGILNDGPIIGIGVRLCEQKGIPYLLRAMPDIIKEFPECTLVIAGRGPLEEALIKDVESMGIQSNVRFIGMRLDIPELLKLFDVYVLPSLWEGLPMVLLEAMAAGCPIVATDVGGVSTIIKTGQTGMLVRPRNSADISRDVIRLLLDKELTCTIIKNSLTLFNRQFEAHAMTRRYEALYAQTR